MAAPILTQKQQAACLSKKAAGKSKKKKTQLKNVLFGGPVSRPKTSKQVEDAIMLKLSDVLKGLPNIFKSVRSASNKDQDAKRKVRAQLDLGTNCVCRSLEKDRLACVLVSGKVTPAPSLDHVISLAQQIGCPLLCLDTLSITLAKVTKSKCLPVCIGFKRSKSGSGIADFVDVINLVRQHANVSKRSLKQVGVKSGNNSRTQKLPEAIRPVCLDASTDEAVREELKKIFANAAINKVENRMMTPKERKRKKNKIKQTKTYYRQWFHNQFESGKKTVTQFVGAGKIQLVLVIRQLMPVLMAESSSTSLLCLARDQDCPVLGVSSLSMVMSPDPANSLSVLGIKRESALPPDTKSLFRPVIDKCLDFMRTAPMPTQDMDVESVEEDDDEDDDDSDNDDDDPTKKDYSFLYVSKKDSAELKEKALKLKQEQANASKQMTFGGDFISFGDSSTTSESGGSLLGKRKKEKPLTSALMKPKKMNLDLESSETGDAEMDSVNTSSTNLEKDGLEGVSTTPNGNAAASVLTKAESTSVFSGKGISNQSDNLASSIFSVSRGGDISNKPTNERKVERGGASSSVSTSSSTVLGMDALEASADEVKKDEAEQVSNMFSASTKHSKGEQKKRHGQEGFLSFAYTEANIHTMVANPERKKKKKDKK